MKLLDIHTHNKDKDGHKFILDCTRKTPEKGENISIGIHPWDIDDNRNTEIDKIEVSATDTCVKAIGECGIDLIKSNASLRLQTDILKRHIEISEKCKKPLILHVVKGQEIIMRLHKETHHKQAWIIHGFRGNPEQARQYISAGFYLSYGTAFNKESLLQTSVDRIFIERDNSTIPLYEHYRNIAAIMNISIEELSKNIERNAFDCGLNIL